CGAWRQRYIIVVPALFFPLVGLAIGTLSPRIYTSHTSMLLQETANMNPFLKDLGMSAMIKERMDSLTTLLHSRHILALVAKDMGQITEETSDKDANEIIAALSAGLSVQMAGKELISIQLVSGNPQRMRETLESVSKHFIEQMLAPERSSMKDSSSFLSENLDTRRKELELAEQKLAEYRSANAADMPEMQMDKLTRLAKLKQTLSERKAELAGAEKSLGSLDQQLSRTNPVIGKLEEQIIMLRSELTLLQAKYTANHSKVQGLKRNLSELENERAALLTQHQVTLDTTQLFDLASVASSGKLDGQQPLLISQLEHLQLGRSKVSSLIEEVSSLTAMITELEQDTKSLGSRQQQLAKLERDLVIKRQMYDDLMERYEMARLTSSFGVFEQDKRIRVIDSPYIPTNPSNPHILLFVIGGLFGGFFIGAGIGTVRELTDTSIRLRQDVEELTGATVLCRIPLIVPRTSELTFGPAPVASCSRNSANT
ncbi:MAG: GumC family protein, partial [Shewanella sp.]